MNGSQPPRRLVSRASGLAVVLAAFVLSRIGLLFFHWHVATDLKIYRTWIARAMAGETPFLDFPIEYPPLAWWVMQLPGTLEREAYAFRFRLMMGAADIVAFALLWWIVSQRRARALSTVTGAYVATTVILEFVLYDRLDMIVVATLLGAWAAWLRSLERDGAPAWSLTAYALVGLGTTYKLMPIVLLPIFVLAHLNSGRIRLAVSGVAIAVAVALAPFAALYPIYGTSTFGFLQYHSARGIDIGSTWATIMWLASLRDETLHIVVRFASWELVGTIEPLIRRAASVGPVALLAGLLIWGLALGRRFTPARAYLQGTLAMSGVLTVLGVLSVQYLLWAFPAMLLAASETGASDRAIRVIAAVTVVIALLTTAFFPLSMPYVMPLNGWLMVLLAARNVLYVAAFGWIAGRAIRRDIQTRPV